VSKANERGKGKEIDFGRTLGRRGGTKVVLKDRGVPSGLRPPGTRLEEVADLRPGRKRAGKTARKTEGPKREERSSGSGRQIFLSSRGGRPEDPGKA